MAGGESPRQPTQPTRWFYRIDGKEFGPVTDNSLRQLARSGKLTRSAHVRKGLNGKWVTAVNVKGLFPAEVSAIEPVAETVAEPSFDPLASDRNPTTKDADARPANVPVLAFASAKALDSVTRTDAPLGESPKLPPPRSVYAAQAQAAPTQLAGANTDERKKSNKLLYIAVGGGGLLLLALIGVGFVWMLSGNETEVAEAPTQSQLPSAATTLVAEPPADTANDAVQESATVTEPSATDPFADPLLPEPAMNEIGEASPVASGEPFSTPENGRPNATQTAVTQDESTSVDQADAVADPSAEIKAPVAKIAGPVADDVAMSPASAPVAAEVAPESVTQDDRQKEETNEATKLVVEIDANVKERLQQIVERTALGKQMETNRAEYQRVLTALGIATNDLPRMEQQFRKLQVSRQDAINRMSTEKIYIQVEANLSREMATLAQQIAQVTNVGNAALRAKPGLEQQWGEQTKQLLGLQQREGALHQELMAALDPFGHHSDQYREQLMTKSSDWGTSCVEASLIRGFTQFYDARIERAVEDFSDVVSKLNGVLKQKRIAKDSPELKVVQTALAARGLALFKLGKEPEGIADLGKAVGANEQYTLPVMFRGMVEAQRGRHEAAFRDFETARRLNDPHASREAARLFITSPSHGNPTRALTLAKEACSLETLWSNQEVLAAALAANGQNTLAREAYREAASRAPVDQCKRLNAAAAGLAE